MEVEEVQVESISEEASTNIQQSNQQPENEEREEISIGQATPTDPAFDNIPLEVRLTTDIGEFYATILK